MGSVWSENVSLPSFDRLNGNIKTDVLIIGGGIAGILCAHCLKSRGVDTVLVEAETLCGGITKDTTAKITAQHGFIYQKLVKSFGKEKARMYYDANSEALEVYRQMSRDIECDFENKDSYVYSTDSPEKVSAELEALQKINVKAEYVGSIRLPFDTSGAVKFTGQAQFNPLKFLAALLNNITVYENTAVRRIDGKIAVTDNGSVTAEKTIVTTHFPFINKHGSYFLKMYQQRSYVMAVENAERPDGMYVDGSGTGMSLRSYRDLVLVGGGGHRTGKPGGGYSEIESFIKENYRAAEIKYKWATQDCMTLDGVPYIGKYSAMTGDLYVAAGFNKWGMTTSMAAAKLLSDMVCGIHNKYEELFSPSRSMLKPQLAVNTLEALSGWAYPSAKRCPHLGCVLKWNKQEHTWDCPCHGSRFTREGKLIDNPATGNLKRFSKR